MYLLMYTLLFSHTIMLLVGEVRCLQHSNVQTHAMKTLVVNNARYCTTSFLLFLYHPIHLKAANVLMGSGHSFTVTTGTCSVFLIIKANTASLLTQYNIWTILYAKCICMFLKLAIYHKYITKYKYTLKLR